MQAIDRPDNVAAAPRVAEGASLEAAARLPVLLRAAIAIKAVALAGLAVGHGRLGWFVLFAAPDPLLLIALFVPSAQGLCRVFTRFATERRTVWLTIDDGPDETDTPQLLDLLDRHGAKATFFVVGERAERWPHLVEEIVRRGHQIGHHTQTHPAWSLWSASPRRLARELDAPLDNLRRHGVRPEYFRPPVGIKHLLLGPALARRGLTCLGWTIRSGDCRSRSGEKLIARVLARVEPGAILLVHEGPSVPAATRVTAIARLLEALAARGFSCEIPEPHQLR